MRQLSVIALVTLIAGSAFAGTVVATDPPDIRLGVGEALPAAFDLSDYVVGGEGDVIDIAGSSTVGVSEETYTVAGETVSNVVKVSSFLVQNGPALDGSGANPFVNVLDPGQAVNSVAALVGGGGASPGGVSAAWSVVFANVAVSYNEGLRVRNTALVTPAGLTANIDAAGNYTLSCDASFAGPVIVSFVNGAGDDVDGTSLLASKNLADSGQTMTLDGSVAEGFQRDVFALVQTGVTEVTVSVDYVAQAGCTSVALAAMDGAFLGEMAYVNPSVAAGDSGTMTVVYTPDAGSVYPLVQAVGGPATFSNVKVYAAPSLVDLAYGANELPLGTDLFTGAGSIDGNFDSVTDVAVLSPGAPNTAAGSSADVSISTDNNFGDAGQSIALGEATGGFDNVTVVAVPSAGCIAARAWIKGQADVVNFVLTGLTAGLSPATAIGNEVQGGAANWTPMLISGDVSADVAVLWATVQAVGGGNGALLVDDVKVMQILDMDEYFDADLFAL